MPAYEESGITASVSCSAPSGPHMWPPIRIMAGIEASTITSLGTCRLVMPRSESTMASSGPSARPCSIAALISAPFSGGSSASRPDRMPPSPLLGLRPAAARSAPYCSKTAGRKACTTWPKMIGSETFIMVAFRCTENSTPSVLARAICAARNSSSAATCMAVASTTSPVSTGTESLSTVVAPSSPTSSIRSDPSLGITADVSLRAEVVGGHVRDLGLRVRRPGAHASADVTGRTA